MKKVRLILLVIMILMVALATTGCVRPYKTPIIEEISASQTAFLIPLEADGQDQENFQSEDFLKQNLVPTKRIEMPQRWLQTGRLWFNGKWIPSAKLIVVERQPVVREWTDVETTNDNREGILAEGKDGIGFTARMNISAQIEEKDASKFLYRYNNKPLEQIMDNEIRALVSTTFVEEISHLNFDEIIQDRNVIMQKVRDTVMPYFKERGITITVLGLEGEFSPVNIEIQKSMDKKFTEERLSEAQAIANQRNISQAQAEAEAVKIRESIMTQTIQLRELEIKEKYLEKWDGKLPNIMTNGDGGMMLQLPVQE